MDGPVSFGTDGWRARGEQFTTERVRAVGRAVTTYLDEQRRGGAVAIGYDARSGSRSGAETLADVVADSGRDATIAERDCPTPALAWTVAEGGFAGGLMVTASHNPPEYNGVKVLTDSGAPALPTATDVIETHLFEPPAHADVSGGTIEERSLREPYVESVLAHVGADLTGLTVAYDAMHGSGRGVTDEVLARAGAETERVRCSRDTDFGGVAPEPGPETAGAVRERVCGDDPDADIGLINDGDADRVGIVTPERGYLDPNVVLAVLYEFLLDRADGGAVVRSVPTSSLVDRVAAAAGETVHETPVGFKWVADAMRRHDALAGGEESGGYGLTRHLPNKDGVLVGLLACAAEAERPLDDRIADLRSTHGPVHQGRVSVDCPDDRKETVVGGLEADPPAQLAATAVESVTAVDGVKLALADDTWVLVRPSGTEPKLRVYAEAASPDRVQRLLAAGREQLEDRL